GIGYRLQPEDFGFSKYLLEHRDLGWVVGTQPVYPIPGDNCGQRNQLGLTAEGWFAIDEMMRLGIMIDIDHMSQETVRQVFEHVVRRGGWGGYPINSGHNGFRTTANGPVTENDNENSRTEQDYRALIAFGGMIGLGHGGNATGFVNSFRRASQITQGRNVAIGTDANGFYALAAPEANPNNQVDYNNFPRYESPRGVFWDINKSGFAHYGMFPDFIRNWQSLSEAPMTPTELASFNSTAEDFVQMWELCQKRSREIFGSLPNTRTFTPETIVNLCPNVLQRGNRTLEGDIGISGDITLQISPDGNRLEGIINISIRETGADRTNVTGSWVRTLYTAPNGMRISSVNTRRRVNINQTVSRTSGVLRSFSCPHPVIPYNIGSAYEHIFAPNNYSFFNRIILQAFTGANSISIDADCECETRISNIHFNPISITLVSN
ncbi:MAG: membrane dipeptidase, partial [Rickettsiales bacterium]